MTVTAIPFEQGRFFVSSQSRTNVTHIVDLLWQEEKWQRPRPFCSCEESMAKGHVCKHILATVSHEKARLNL